MERESYSPSKLKGEKTYRQCMKIDVSKNVSEIAGEKTPLGRGWFDPEESMEREGYSPS